LNATQRELTHVEVRRSLTHADIQRTERELAHVEGILVNLYASEQFGMEEEQFSRMISLIFFIFYSACTQKK